MTGYVYAIENADGLVKIGWSTDPRRRLSKINSDTSSPCQLLGYVEGTLEQEATLHRLLQSEVEHREWFRPGPLVSAFLAAIPTYAPPGPRSNGGDGARKLAAYLARTFTSDAAFAAQIGASMGAVRKWKRGERMPRPVHLTRIREVTGGAVTADDFVPPSEGAAA